MADPLSIASGALAVITATQSTASVIYKFIRDCREARADLTRVTGELSELTLIIELIRDDNSANTKHRLPNELEAQVQAMLLSCTTTVQQIEHTLAKCRGKPGPLRWTMFEKDNVNTLKGSLEAFKSCLNLTLETVNLSITREIKRDTSEILAEIYQLRTQLPPSYPSDQDRFRCEQWLDSLTHYAETVVSEELLDVVSFPDDTEEKGSDGETNHSQNVGEQGVSNDGVASQPSPCITPGTKSIYAGDTKTSVCRRDTSMASGKDRIDSEIEDDSLGSPRTRPMQTHIPVATNRISHNMIASIPCISNIVRSWHCMELDFWATLHEDLILRLWSSRNAELIVSLPVLRGVSGDPSVDTIKPIRHYTRLTFFPAKPEFILIQMPHKVEVWNWKRICKISIASDAQATFDKDSIDWVLHQTTLIYALDHKGDLMVVDLDEPLVSRKISLSMLTGRPQGDLENLNEYVLFVSRREICIMWKRSTMRHNLARGKRSPCLTEIYRLPSTTDLQRVSVTTRYSDDVIKQARVTARYRLPRHIRSIHSAKADLETRRLILVEPNEAQDRRERWPRKLYVLDLDTGSRLSELHLSGKNIFKCPPPFQYLFSWNPKTNLTTVVRVKDGCDLGILEGTAYMTSFGKAILAKQVASELQFGTTLVNLDELGK
ncbi:hypothetical protein F4679DRAFT_544396 [Xylaria curta]|nr:hypothetical protein F4679DRAFT_544396 [Xylaria curta]